jgi:DNA-directed RNA polymerase subunit omega
MARITIEDCLDNENNRFALVRLASRRAKQILAGAKPVTDTKGNRQVVSALREIADGKVSFAPAFEVAPQLEDDTDELS